MTAISKSGTAPVKTQQVCVRFTPAEYARVSAAAEQNGISVPRLIRSLTSLGLTLDAIQQARQEAS